MYGARFVAGVFRTPSRVRGADGHATVVQCFKNSCSGTEPYHEIHHQRPAQITERAIISIMKFISRHSVQLTPATAVTGTTSSTK